MKRYLELFATVVVFGCMVPTCTPPLPAPDAAPPLVDAGECTREAELAKVCPPCVCAQDAGVIVVEAGPTDSGFPNTPCGRSCANYALHGCEEQAPNCVAACEHLVSSKLTPYSPDCVFGAASLTSLRKCPMVQCLKGH